MSMFNYNRPSAPVPFLSIEPATIALGALKKAEDAEALVVRLVETTGQATTARITLEGGAAQKIRFRPFEIKTFMSRVRTNESPGRPVTCWKKNPRGPSWANDRPAGR